MTPAHNERAGIAFSGYIALIVALGLLLSAVSTLIGIASGDPSETELTSAGWRLGLLALGLAFIVPGIYMLQPNEAATLQLFGAYTGTDRGRGLRWSIPFFSRKKLSLRARTFLTEKLKVNDQRGNPVEIAGAIIWRVDDTAKALFDVDDYEAFVRIQSETALRHLASAYPYDTMDADDVPASRTLRGGAESIAETLASELGERLAMAGLVVDQTKLTHLAYAPEIANAMLRRQQAEAVIAARRKIVEGAVGMVEMALAQLAERKMVELDDERRAAMVSNLLVVLCGEREVTPVVNSGTLYT
ncbi:SPFH domain-containing protein [Niveibacterium sp. 24ML]|uniref:SPFH domain-containing protein n=1 Tax=Niveibacterium sp. 24ML TaxID=2985512 RepID=UPI00226E6D91|nr:SPFH domain-containing protein [Niveibacterium sp. 24ML]MCX9157869.1 SPFH domain-containing protein [Niveibacterium sp. 24ML]